MINCIHSLRIQSFSVLNSVQEGMQEHVVRKKSRWFVQGSFNGEAKQLHRSLTIWSIRNGLEWSAITELRVGARCQLFTVPSRRQFSPSVQNSSYPGSAEHGSHSPKSCSWAAFSMAQHRASKSTAKTLPQEALKLCWHRQCCGGSTGEKVVCQRVGREEGLEMQANPENVGTFHLGTGISPKDAWVCLERILPLSIYAAGFFSS